MTFAAVFYLMGLSAFTFGGTGTCVTLNVTAPGPDVTGYNMAIDLNGYTVENFWWFSDLPFTSQNWFIEDGVLVVTGLTCPGIDGGAWAVAQVKLGGCAGGPIRYLATARGGHGTRWLQQGGFCWGVRAADFLDQAWPCFDPRGDQACTDPNS